VIPVKYIGALFDNSGYAAASRGYIACLLETGQIDLTCEAVSFETQKTTHGVLGELVKPLLDKPLQHKIQIIHLTPDNFPRFVRPDKYNIGYCAWETSKLPDPWHDYCNMMNEIWVPSNYNIDVFRQSGVTKPIYKILHGIEKPNLTNIVPMEIGNPDTFVFYSIFQWIERKNPICLLKAYLTEFTLGEDVNLVVKSYRLNTSPEEQGVIKSHVSAIKKALNLSSYPPITFYGGLFTSDQIQSLHMRGNCFVLPVRSEGFGITQAEAMMFSKPTISSNYGGALEFMNSKNSFLIKTYESPVYGMLFPNYNAHMNWGEPDVMDLRRLMRYVFDKKNKAEVQARAVQGQQDVERLLNWKKVGQDMLERLNTISNSLGKR
jgi:glycosyltransferase involved in cell wall biosynthesis